MSVSKISSINSLHASQQLDEELILVLMKYGHNTNHTPLWNAIIADDLQAVRTLLKNGYSPDEQSVYYPLCATFYHKNLDILKVLLEYGANPFILQSSQSPEIYSCMYNAIMGYCYSSIEEDAVFYKEVIDRFIKAHPNLKDPIVCFKGKKYSAREVCTNLNLTRYDASSITYTQKQRASQLAGLFISKGG